MKIQIDIDARPSQTVRARQLSAAFDVPARDRERLEWHGELPVEDRDWNVGLIVGPSGSGKSTILREAFGKPRMLKWTGHAVVDDFPKDMSIEDVAAACSSVGFNTIPAWLRPYKVLSTGEQFRVTLARLIAEAAGEMIVVDEFTSVVDRQVAKIGAHAVQRQVRKHGGRLVAATCHYDVQDWLQPDWVFEPGSMSFSWRCLQPRPGVQCAIARVPFGYWRLFAPFHYLTAELHRGAACFVLFAGDPLQPAAFAGVLHRPSSNKATRTLKGVSRLVTLPDWQGLGLAFALVDRLGAAYNTLGMDLHTYPAHPALIRSFDRSRCWELRQKPSSFQPSKHSTLDGRWKRSQGMRPNAVFRYRGPGLERRVASALVNDRDVYRQVSMAR